jgi:hypothetical protein
MAIDNYPLTWPQGWPKTPAHKQGRSRFNTPFMKAMSKLQNELRLLGAKNIVVSSNVPVRKDGMMYSDASKRRVIDPGVAVYFQLKGKQMAMARDAYWTPHENLTGLMHAISHMRGLSRHGGDHMMYQAFEGFAALAPPSVKRSWWEVLGVSQDASSEEIYEAFKAKARKAHPDTGGSHSAMAELNSARDEALRI